MNKRLWIEACALLALSAGQANAGVIFGFNGNGLGGGFRWDAAPRVFNLGGQNYERSLNGGLRFSLQGGSYQAYRDLFTWQGGVAPSVPDFTNAVNSAFNAWMAPDPVSGLNSGLTGFIADFNTPVEGTVAGGGVNNRGAEIDLFGRTTAQSWGVGNPGTRGEAFFTAAAGAVDLTSGTIGYAGGGAITGADVTLNSNPQAVYTLDLFRRLLTHEIGHALGLGDIEGNINPGAFIDDNFDGTSPATAAATLTNSWAAMVNPLNPGASVGLSRYTVPFANPGTTTPNVDILMESNGLGIGPTNPVTALIPLANDDYGTRQFLYPTIPAPGTMGLLAIATIVVGRRRR